MADMVEEVDRFVASLAIPDDRKAIVRAELADHVECALRDGNDPRAALGDLEALRRALEAIESAFRVPRWHAFVRGLFASALVAFLIDRAGLAYYGIVPALATLAIAIGFAPPRTLELLRAELRVPPVRGGLFVGFRFGPALTYLLTIVAVPIIVWTTMIFVNATVHGVTSFETPLSAFTLVAAVWPLVIVEAIRARHRAVV